MALLAALGLVGCAEYRGLEATGWTLLSHGGEPRAIDPNEVPILPSSQRSYELRATFALPPQLQGRPLWLSVPSSAMITIDVGGDKIGPLEGSVFERYRHVGYGQCFAIPARLTQQASLPVSLQIQRTVILWHAFDKPPRLSPEPRCDAGFQTKQTLDDLVRPTMVAIFMVIAVVHFVSFAFDRRRKAELWFAAGMATISAQCLEGVGVFQPLGLGWWLPVTVLLGTLSNALCCLFFKAYFEQRSPPAWLLAGVLGLGLVALLSWPDPLQFSILSPLAVVLMNLVVMGYVALLLWRHARAGERRLDARAMLASWLTIGLSLLFVLLLKPFFIQDHVLVLVPPRPLALAGLCAVHTTLLARDRTRTLRSLNEQLTARVDQLEARNREVASLNDDLRHQLRARSRALGDELARTSAPEVDMAGLSPGSVVNGRYRVVAPLGEGGMGSVFAVEHINDGRRLALKVLHRARSGAELARLAREAELVASVTHPRLVGIVDINVSSSGQLYIVMELVEGKPLSRARSRHGDVPWALSVLGQIAEGLSALHQAGVVHRDIKPANILLAGPDDAPAVKLIDLGIASRAPLSPLPHPGDASVTAPQGPLPGGHEIGALVLAGERGHTLPLPQPPENRGRTLALAPRTPGAHPPAAPPTADAGPDHRAALHSADSLTVPGQILGTPDYMAPELAWGSDRATAASDIWSLGIVAHALLARSKPFDEPPLVTVTRGLPCPVAPALASLQPGLDPALGALLDRCLDPDPTRRPAAEVLADALSPAGASALAVAHG